MAHTVSVREVMSSEYLGVHEGEEVTEVAAMLADHREDQAVVLDGRRAVGLVSAVDLLEALLDGAEGVPVGACMRAPVATVTPEATIEHAIERLTVAEADGLVVVDVEDNALGMVDARDLLTATDGLLEDHLEVAVHDSGDRSPPSMSEQGVCESCGRLADTLHESNGTLLCTTCADL